MAGQSRHALPTIVIGDGRHNGVPLRNHHSFALRFASFASNPCMATCFLEMGEESEGFSSKGWRILSGLRAKSQFFIETNAIPLLTMESLEAVLASPKHSDTNSLHIVIALDDLPTPTISDQIPR